MSRPGTRPTRPPLRVGALAVPRPPDDAPPGAGDAAPAVRTLTDLLGNRRRIAYVGRRLEWVEETDGARTRYLYDGAGRLTGRIDALGRAARWSYDAGGRLAAAVRPGRGTVTFEHDAAGDLVRQRWPGGESLEVAILDGRPAELIFGGGDRVRLRHDAGGRPLAAEEEGLTTRWRLGADGRPVAIERVVDGVPFLLRLDGEGGAAALEPPGGSRLDLAPPADGDPGAAAAFDEPFTLDRMGHLTARGGERFGYDERGQLTAAEAPDGRTVRYGYDAAGNRTVRRGPEGETRYRYGRGDRLLEVAHPDGRRERLRWDANGALVARDGGGAAWRWVYGPRRRPVEVHRDGRPLVRYRYDFTGRRIGREAGGETVLYHHDALGRLAAVTDAAGRPRLALAHGERTTAAWLFGGDGAATRLTLVRDRLGSTRRILDAAGACLWEGRYSPFGRLEGEPPPIEVPLFAGKMLDRATGLYDFGARDYDPALGRFVTPDPWTGGPDDPRLAAAGGGAVPPASWLAEPRTAHPYLYCLNDPLSLVDPHGLGWVRAMFANILAFVWSLPWTVFGLGLTLIDWLFQFGLFGFLWLPEYGLSGAASGRIGSAAMLNIGGLFSTNLVLANVLFGQRGFFDQLDDTREEYIVPEDARPDLPDRKLRTADTAYREHLLVHTIQANFSGPFWPLVYAIGHDHFERAAVRESGFTRLAEPTLTLGPEKVISEHGALLTVVGGQKPYNATMLSAGFGAVGPFFDHPQFSEARFAPLYNPGKVEIRVADARGFSDSRTLEIEEIEVDDVEVVRPSTVFLDTVTDSRPVGADPPQEPTLRLIDQQAATLSIEIDPKGGQVVFEADPPNSLNLSRTSASGDAELTVTPAAAPAVPAAGSGIHGITELGLVVRPWNAAGPVIKRVRVRSMATIQVVLQAHVVRRNDGTDAAITPQKRNEFLQTANRIWRQAGIQFVWRAAVNFIDQTALLVIDATATPAGAGAVNFVSADINNLQTFNPDPANPRPVPATDIAALHVYFVQSLSITGGVAPGSTIEAFADRGLGRLVIPASARLSSFAHELGHLLGLASPHPDQESPPARDAARRLMHSSAETEPFLISNVEPRRASAAAPHRGDETAEARVFATGRMGP